MAVWLIRAGERSRHARSFADNRIIAIGWPDIDGLNDLRGMSRVEILGCLEKADHIRTPAQDTEELLTFRDQMHIGDVVVTPDATTNEVLIGQITGPYQYLVESPALDYHHVRDVQWYGRWDRSLLSADMKTQTGWRRTILRPDAHAAEWATLGEKLQAGEGRPPDAGGRRRSSSGLVARKRSVPPPTTRVCGQCGYRLSSAMFAADSDLCADCRGD